MDIKKFFNLAGLILALVLILGWTIFVLIVAFKFLQYIWFL